MNFYIDYLRRRAQLKLRKVSINVAGSTCENIEVIHSTTSYCPIG